MANRRMDPVGYRRFRPDPLMSEGLLAVPREGGDLERRVALGMTRAAGYFSERADRAAARLGTLEGAQAALAGAPDGLVAGGVSGTAAAAPETGAVRVGPRAANDGAAFAKTYLIEEHGLPTHVASAIAGHGMQESGFDLSAVGDNGTAEGVFQWRGERLTGLKRFAAGQNRDWQDLQTQLDYAVHELSTSESYAGEALKNASTVEEAVAAFMHFERPAGYTREDPRAGHGFDNRLAFARGLAGVSGEASGSTIAPASVAPVSVTPVSFTSGSGAAFQPSGRDTIRGRAYDVAGTRTYLEMIQTTLHSDMRAVYEAHRDDPAQLRQSFTELKQAHLNEHVFREIAPDYAVMFDRQAESFLERASAEKRRRAEQQNLAGFLDRTSELETQKSRLLVGESADSAPAMDELAAVQATIDAHYDSAVARGVIDPVEAEKAKHRSRSQMLTGFYVRQAEELDAEGITTMREAMRADYAAGRLEELDAETWFTLDSQLAGLADDKRVKDIRAAEALAKRGDSLAARIASGYDVPESELADLRLDARTGPNGQAIVDEGFRKIDIARTIRDLPPAEAARIVREFQREQRALGTEDGMRAAEFAGEAFRTKIEALKTDPISYAERRGLVEPDTGLTGVTTADDMAALIAKRAGQAETIARRYGTPVRYFKAGEAEAFAELLEKDIAEGGALATALISGGGPETLEVLPELADANPTVAHLIGVAAMTGDASLIGDAGRVLADRANGTSKIKLPADTSFGAATIAAAGSALEALPETEAAAMTVAKLLFERQAARDGFDPKELATAGTPAHAAWSRALNRALGGRVVDGRQLGGIGTVNGAQTVLPTDMTAGEVEARLASLDEEALKTLPPIHAANGVTISPRQIRGAQLVAIGDGRYWVATGGLDGPRPDFLVGKDGGLWVLDVHELSSFGDYVGERLQSGGDGWFGGLFGR